MSVTLDGLQLSINQQAFKIENLENKVSSLQKTAIDISSLKENITNQDIQKEYLYKTLDQYEKHTKENTKSVYNLSEYAKSIDAKIEKLSSKVDKFIMPELEKISKKQSEMQEEQKKTNALLLRIASKLDV